MSAKPGSIDRRPWATEVIANTLRVIDSEGHDVVLVGNVHDPDSRAVAQFICAAVNAATRTDGKGNSL